MNTINTNNSSNLSIGNKFTNEMKSSFLVADILDKKTINSKSTEDEDDEKIDVEEDIELKMTKNDNNAINLSSSRNEKSPIRSNSIDSNQLNQLNQLNHFSQLNSQLSNQLSSLSQLSQLSQLNSTLQSNEQESLLNSIYSKLFEAKQLDSNLLTSLDQSKIELKQQQSKVNSINANLTNPLSNSISNLIKTTNSNPINENQLTNATGKFNFSSLFNTHPHLFAQSLEAMAAANAADSFPIQQVQNLAQMTQNFSNLTSNYPSALMPSTSKLSNQLANTSILDQLRNSQHLQQPKELLNKTKLPLSNQPNAIDIIKQFQGKMQSQLSDDAKFDKNAFNFAANPLLFNSALSQAYNRNGVEQDSNNLNKLCSNFNIQQLLYHQHLQNLQKHAFQYPIQNGLLNNNAEPDVHNSQNFLMENFFANHDKQMMKTNFSNHHTNEEEEEMNGISRTNSPASSHSSAIATFNNESTAQMTTFHPSMDYTWVCHSKQMQRKRTVFNAYQRTQLEQSFKEKRYITKSDRVLLAKKIGLNDSQIKVWYINRRTKHRNEEERKTMRKK